MLLRNTLLYLPAQVIGPLAQLISMIVWTHVVDEPTLGVVTLLTATHELLQIVFLTGWSQYALRFLERHQENGEAERFYRTENAFMIGSCLVQSILAIAALFTMIVPQADAQLVAATVAYVCTRSLNLYISDRARVRNQIGIYTLQVTLGPSLGLVIGLILIRLIDRSATWPLAGYAIAQLVAILVVLPRLGCGRGVWPLDRVIVSQALRYGLPLIIGGALGWIGLNAPRFIVNQVSGVAAAGLFAVGYGLGQRAATFAAMLVTTAAFPLAVKSMERHGASVAMRQLADNSALLIAILAPCIAGIFMLRREFVHLLIAPPFQEVTLAVLPLSVLAGSIRSLRAHFIDQTFLLHNRTGLLATISAVDAALTVLLSFIFIRYWELSGGAGATVVAALVAAIASFTIAFSRFGLTLPLKHVAPVGAATAIMAEILNMLPEASSMAIFAAHVALGGAIYIIVLGMIYAPLLSALRLRHRQSES
ncbi:MAG: lipopolysaccharide biosynthesis protein [Bradyrhizobium sp.]|nr:lipopolysaccharide biosynthesis protein [Pseudomonadota bacterium]MDE2473349.1 lipopolysaccharide biosynthesis protein [Bradyrhizobium sp.]